MTAYKGNQMLLKLGDGLSPTTYTTIAGLRTTEMTSNGELVDITSKDSNGFRELLAGAGISSLSISANGIFQNDNAIKTMFSNNMNRTVDSYQLAFGNGQVMTGNFQVTSFKYSGEYNGAQLYDITLESSGSPILQGA